MISINKTFLTAILGSIIFTACKVNKNNASKNTQLKNTTLNTVTVRPTVKPPYRETVAEQIDLVHMQLAVGFNYSKQFVLGKAVLTAKPYL